MEPENLYFIALLPPPELQQEIRKIQLKVAELFSSKKALNAPPHITIVPPFRCTDEEMKGIMETLEGCKSKFTSFNLELNGFNHFGNRTIYIQVVPNPAVNNLHQVVLSGLLPRFVGSEEGEGHPFSPHISIARRDLKSRIFGEAWNYYSRKKFHATFSVSGFSLMIYEEHLWRENKYFRFGEE